jgi:radical SAM protein with 4Fe4S-binding SPASM domain
MVVFIKPFQEQGRRRIAPSGVDSSCYFRTSTYGNERKALLQITERCNLHCAHCFVSAGREGLDLSLADVGERVLPQLDQAGVTRVTLTGGEPFAHPEVLEIVRAVRERDMRVTLCTNGTLVDEPTVDALVGIGGVSVNVSLDGFSARGHGKFRGSPESFQKTVATAHMLGERGVLKGILATPNALADPAEYEELCAFALKCGAEYVLMNPLASMGRGVRGARRLAASKEQLREVAERSVKRAGSKLDVVQIRFPNDDKPLSGCEAGTILYVFANGDVTVCPYLVFAARTPQSNHRAEEFIVGNVLTQADVARRLDEYRLHDRKQVSGDALCRSCDLADRCGRGCPAAVIAAGGHLGERDAEQCPRTPLAAAA